MKVLILTRYDNLAASSRYRFLQYLPFLEKAGFDCTVAPLLNNDYVQQLNKDRGAPLPSIVMSYLQRLRWLLKQRHFDLIWLQMEAFPWLPFVFERLFLKTNLPVVVDYDDAWFHRYDDFSVRLIRWVVRGKIDQIMRHARMLIVGNQYLADHAIQAGAARVEQLPTVINLELYPALPHATINKTFTIGWIGSSSTSRHLKEGHQPLVQFAKEYECKLVALGVPPAFDMDGVPLDCLSWSQEKEVEWLHSFDVGIMPLPDAPLERGKCGFKLIQYMAAGSPVIASPVGINQQIVEHGSNGFLATTSDEWVRALVRLHSDAELRQQMGQAGRRKVEQKYCLQVTAPRLARLLREAAA